MMSSSPFPCDVRVVERWCEEEAVQSALFIGFGKANDGKRPLIRIMIKGSKIKIFFFCLIFLQVMLLTEFNDYHF